MLPCHGVLVRYMPLVLELESHLRKRSRSRFKGRVHGTIPDAEAMNRMLGISGSTCCPMQRMGPRPFSAAMPSDSRRVVLIRAQNWWEEMGDKLKGGGGKGPGNKEDAARKAIQVRGRRCIRVRVCYADAKRHRNPVSNCHRTPSAQRSLVGNSRRQLGASILQRPQHQRQRLRQPPGVAVSEAWAACLGEVEVAAAEAAASGALKKVRCEGNSMRPPLHGLYDAMHAASMHDGMPDKPLSPEAGGEGAEQPLWQEFLELMHGIWVVFVNTAIFLAFANMLHR